MKLLDHNYDLTPLQRGYADFVDRWAGDDDPHHADGRFHASMLGLCRLQAVLKRAGLEGRPLSSEQRSMFAEAKFIHVGMTKFWLHSGLAIDGDMPDRDTALADGPFPGWSGKFDALFHHLQWCECDDDPVRVARSWDAMRLCKKAGDEDWEVHRDYLRAHQLVLVSLKTVHPNGLKFRVDGPSLHHVRQDSWYSRFIEAEYGLAAPIICVMYRSRGGSADPIFHFVEPLEVESLVAEYDAAYDVYLEERKLPDRLPLVVKLSKDGVFKLEQGWQCSYCAYSGWHTNVSGNYRCEALSPTNATGDRVAQLVDGRVYLITEWYRKTGHAREYVVSAISEYYDELGATPPEFDEVVSAKLLKNPPWEENERPPLDSDDK